MKEQEFRRANISIKSGDKRRKYKRKKERRSETKLKLKYREYILFHMGINESIVKESKHPIVNDCSFNHFTPANKATKTEVVTKLKRTLEKRQKAENNS